MIAPNLAKLAEETPNFWDERMRKLAAMPFSLAGIKAVEEEFRFLLEASPKKILAVDADNTLWDGIISEDGAEDVALHRIPEGASRAAGPRRAARAALEERSAEW